MPTISDLKKQRGLSKIGELAEKKPYLFVMRRRSVSLGFSIGLAWGVIPLPIQIFGSLFTCYMLKANIPAAIFAAFLTNPLTSPLILATCYQLGKLFITPKYTETVYAIPDLILLIQSPLDWINQLYLVFSSMGQAILVGIPITSFLFGILGYWIVNFSWIYSVLNKRKKSLLARKLNYLALKGKDSCFIGKSL